MELPYAMFKECTSLETVSIPNGIEKIDFDTFLGCTSLKSVYIPSSVNKIGHGAFGVCTSLSDINFGGNKNEWKSVDGIYGALGNKKDNWCYGSGDFIVHCTDGDLEK